LPLEGPIFALVEDWRRSQPKIPSRNEAIRLLLRRALEHRALGIPEESAAASERGGTSVTSDNMTSEQQKNAPPKRGKLKEVNDGNAT
jgi:hypothetical protein